MVIINNVSLLLLLAGLLILLVSSLGGWLMTTVYGRLHYSTLAASAGSLLIIISLFIQIGFTSAGIKLLLIGFILLISSPVLSHALARASLIRNKGKWKIHIK